MKIIIIIFLSFYVFSHNFLFSKTQNYLSVKGIVKDQNTKKTLSFANISIKEKYIGTLTNEKGKFNFKFLKKYKNDTLCISYIGYSTLEKSIKLLNFGEKKYQIFYLKKTDSQLLPITIIDKKITAKEIINKAIKKIPDNYYTDEHLMETYFISEENLYNNGKLSENMKTEAAIKIYTPKYKKRHRIYGQKTDEIFKILGIKKERKTYKKDTFLLMQKNILKKMIFRNIFRYKDRGKYYDFLNKRKNKHYKFTIKNNINYNGNLIYEISFNNEKKNKNFLSDPIKSNYGKIYIRQKDYAILAIDTHQKYYSDFSKSFLHIKIIYKSYKEKLFLSFISLNYNFKIIDEKYKQEEEFKNYFDSTSHNIKLLINKVETENITKIKKNNFEKKHFHLQDSLKYDKEFWENYNYILDTIPEQRDSLLFK